MTPKVKQKLLKKSCSFNGKKIVLYSLDGVTWSSRDWEPEKIKERQETEKIRLESLSEDGAKPEAEGEKSEQSEDGESPPVADDADEAPAKRGRKPGAKTKQIVKPKLRETQGQKVAKKKPQAKKRAA